MAESLNGVDVNLRCPGCGTEDTSEMTAAPQDHATAESGDRVSPYHRVTCQQCGAADDGMVFMKEHEWERKSDEEKEKARRAQERGEAAATAWQESAEYQHSQREP